MSSATVAAATAPQPSLPGDRRGGRGGGMGGNSPATHAPATLPLREKIQEYLRTLDVAYKQLAKLNEESKVLNLSTPDYTRRRDELRVQMDRLQEQMATLEKQRTEIEKQQKELATVPAPASCGGALEDIDSRIRAAEREMMVKRLTAPQETKIIKQISALRQQRVQVVADAQTAASRAAKARAQAQPLRDRLEAIKAELAECQRKRRDLNESLSALNNKRRETTIPLREIADQREILEKQIVETRGLLNRTRNEVSTLQRQFEAEQGKQRQKRAEQRAQQKRMDDLLKRKADLEEKLESMEGEIQTPEFVQTQRMLLYIQSLVERLQSSPAAHGASEAPPKDGHTEGGSFAGGPVASPPATLDGQVLLSKPSEPEEHCPLSKRKKKRGQKKPVVVAPNAPLVHDIQVLADFQRLQLAPPLTLRECPALMETLSQRLEKLQGQQEEQAAKVATQRQTILNEIRQVTQAIDNGGIAVAVASKAADDDRQTTADQQPQESEGNDNDAQP